MKLETPPAPTIHLLYGRSGLTITLPEGCVPTVITKPAMPLLDDPPCQV